MNVAKIIITIIIVITALIGSDTQLLSWGLFNLFTDTQFSAEGLDRVEAFEPSRDILYLPQLNGKDIFEASRDLSICINKAVRRHIYYYLTSKREYVIRAIQQSYQYENIIKEVFKKNQDIPEELSLLPLLESCFNPRAVSASNAVGLWQFVDSTARSLGLKRNRWIDERRDIEKSTEAALCHLRHMRQIFPRWDLALAAYNGGAGYVMRIMNKSGAKDFWKLRQDRLLKDETSEYVPKFIALMLIYKNQRLFGISDEIAVPEKQETETFTLQYPVDLRDIARLSGVPVREIRDLNPELNSTITPLAMKTYQLRLTSDAKKKIRENTSELYKNKLTGVIEHFVKKGETVSGIARLYKKKLNA